MQRQRASTNSSLFYWSWGAQHHRLLVRRPYAVVAATKGGRLDYVREHIEQLQGRMEENLVCSMTGTVTTLQRFKQRLLVCKLILTRRCSVLRLRLTLMLSLMLVPGLYSRWIVANWHLCSKRARANADG